MKVMLKEQSPLEMLAQQRKRVLEDVSQFRRSEMGGLFLSQGKMVILNKKVRCSQVVD